MSGRLPSSLCDSTADIFRAEIFLYVNRAGMRGLGTRRVRPAEAVPSAICFVSYFY